MTLAALAFAAGAALLPIQGAPPALAWAWCVPLLLAIGLRYRVALVAAAFAAGFFWAAACAHWRMNDWLAPELEGRDVAVVGVVSSLPALAERSVRFEFEVEWAGAKGRGPPKIPAGWHATPPQDQASPARRAPTVT